MPKLLAALLLHASVEVVDLPAADRVRLADGRVLGLAGVEAAPSAPPVPDELLAGGWEVSELGDPAPRLWLEREGRSLAEELVGGGLALADLAGLDEGRAARLVAAARSAQERGAGLWSARRQPPLPVPLATPLAGVALPLHSADPDFDYRPWLTEIRGLGAEWVELVVATRQADVRASLVPPRDGRTPPRARLLETIRTARELGLDVLVMPIVLLREAGPREWRGVLAPEAPELWWASYTAYLVSIADVAAEGGAGALCIGSELGSLEHEDARWRRLIAQVRARYPGRLTYSANWDHFGTISFWDELDFAGLNAYFDLSAEPWPTPATVERGWTRGLEVVREAAAVSGLPLVLTEVGIPSRAGALAGPWDHARGGETDLGAQALGFEVFHRVFLPEGRPVAVLQGAFLYDWWGLGGPRDGSYTARGKPAEIVWRRILADLARTAPEPRAPLPE